MATSVSFSPTNDFLATSHVDSVGVYLWYLFILPCRSLRWRRLADQLSRANRAQYAEVSFHGITEDEVADVALPSVQGEAEEEGEAPFYF